jgi:hypothetical protein
VLPNQHKCARSHLRRTRVHVGLQGSYGVALNDGAKVIADMDMRSIAVTWARA